MASDENENEVLAALERVLEPLGERKAEVLSWAAEYLQSCPLLTYVAAQGEQEIETEYPPDAAHPHPWRASATVPKVFEYKLGGPNPLDESYTIFAIFHWHTQGIFVVYSFKAAFLDNGGAVGVYVRDLVFRPRFAQGPVSLDALVSDLEYHTKATPWDDLPEEPESPPALRSGNGNARPSGGPKP
jgi:hypothetical protein